MAQTLPIFDEYILSNILSLQEIRCRLQVKKKFSSTQLLNVSFFFLKYLQVCLILKTPNQKSFLPTCLFQPKCIVFSTHTVKTHRIVTDVDIIPTFVCYIATLIDLFCPGNVPSRMPCLAPWRETKSRNSFTLLQFKGVTAQYVSNQPCRIIFASGKCSISSIMLSVGERNLQTVFTTAEKVFEQCDFI